jgi:hypothetical protein
MMKVSENTAVISILNKRQVKRTFKALAFTKSSDRTALRKVAKAPIAKIERTSIINLAKQRSYKTGKLNKSFRVRSRRRREDYYATFETNSKYSKALNSGTGDRYTKSGRWTGAVGKATTNYKGRNYSFRLGFASRAIKHVLPKIPDMLSKGVESVVNKIIMRENL